MLLLTFRAWSGALIGPDVAGIPHRSPWSSLLLLGVTKCPGGVDEASNDDGESIPMGIPEPILATGARLHFCIIVGN